jgi:hypothetical protein
MLPALAAGSVRCNVDATLSSGGNHRARREKHDRVDPDHLC